MASASAASKAAFKNIVSPAKDMVKSITSKLKASKLAKGSTVKPMKSSKIPSNLLKSLKLKG